MKLILASNSPRRKELLEKLGLRFSIISSNYKEVLFSNKPYDVAVEFALGKAKDVYNNLQNKSGVFVLGADTVVCLGDIILGKPIDENQAKLTLSSLSGRTHKVVTGYALLGDDFFDVGFECSEVTFNNLSENLINEYVKSGLYKGKAGSYGIQDGFPLVKCFSGSYDNIVGLPTEVLLPKLSIFRSNNNE